MSEELGKWASGAIVAETITIVHWATPPPHSIYYSDSYGFVKLGISAKYFTEHKTVFCHRVEFYKFQNEYLVLSTEISPDLKIATQCRWYFRTFLLLQDF